MKRNIPNLVKEVNHSGPGSTENTHQMDANRPTPRHIVIKMTKVKDKKRTLKAERKKQLVTYRGVPIRLSTDFSKETLQARRD